MVVVGPGEVEPEGIGLLPGGGGCEPAAQLRLTFGGEALFAEHRVQPVTEGLPAAGAVVVRGHRGGVQGARPLLFAGSGPWTVHRGEVMQQCLHHVPGRHLTPVETGPHTVGVALPEHGAPAAALVEARQQVVQVVRELPDPARELIHSHRSTPA
ncbi:hypothetical protein [Streptomyces spinosirectus]|uniref:hypothetical protein n=1 Tax=Streptomyces spinosirectus TaxID=2906474 RepID=UPI003BF583A3